MLKISMLLVATTVSVLAARSYAAAPIQAPGAAAVPAAAVAPAGEIKRGKMLFIQCRACHDLQPGPTAKVGPNLAGLFGRKAASVAGFGYSTALKNSSITWDRAQLDRWIEKPTAVVSGNAMAFAGVAVATDRAALLNFLEAETKLGK